MTAPYLTDDSSLAAFMQAFEDTSLPKAEWTHAAHVAAATVYLHRYGLNALPRIRTAIRRYNASKGGPPTAYHETLTIFWLSLLHRELASIDAAGELDTVRATHNSHGLDSRLFKRYYSFDVVASDAARAAWLAPDLIDIEMPFDLTPSLQESTSD